MIKRYQDYEAGIHEHFLGDYVEYEEHLKIVEKLQELAKSAWEVGYATGKAVRPE